MTDRNEEEWPVELETQARQSSQEGNDEVRTVDTESIWSPKMRRFNAPFEPFLKTDETVIFPWTILFLSNLLIQVL